MSVMFSMQSNVDTAGIKADAKRAKEGGDKKVGVAWSHNFLNQKPWHPSNFRNQAKVFEAEQRAAQAAKSNAIAKVCHLETNRVHKGMRISGACGSLGSFQAYPGILQGATLAAVTIFACTCMYLLSMPKHEFMPRVLPLKDSR